VVEHCQSAKLDQASANDLNDLFALFDAVNIGRWCFLAAGIALVVVSMIMFAVYFPVYI
jgi:lysosome membrane protein 2